jgi:hypothetical protein
VATKDADVRTGIGMRLTDRGHVVSAAELVEISMLLIMFQKSYSCGLENGLYLLIAF